MCYIIYKYIWLGNMYLGLDRGRSCFDRQNPGHFAVEQHLYYYGSDSNLFVIPQDIFI